MVIGISGKKQSGKDLTGRIIQILTDSPHFNTQGVKGFLDRKPLSPKFEIKKFADSLKDMICMMIGCTREQLEDEEFKNTILGPDWWYYKIPGLGTVPRWYYPDKENNLICEKRYLVQPTPRLLMQLLGTECGRDILHPNLWVISLFSKYIKQFRGNYFYAEGIGQTTQLHEYPNWIITDMRFPNEVEAVATRDGLLLRIESKRCNLNDKHPSETALDNFKGFDEVIYNDGTIEELIEKVREVLIKHKIINVQSK